MDIFLLHLNCLSACTMKKRYIGREREREALELFECMYHEKKIYGGRVEGREGGRDYVFISYKNHIYVDKKLKMTVFVTCSLYLGCLVMGDQLLQCTWEGMEFLHSKH